jgi:hypothetical protein
MAGFHFSKIVKIYVNRRTKPPIALFAEQTVQSYSPIFKSSLDPLPDEKTITSLPRKLKPL